MEDDEVKYVIIEQLRSSANSPSDFAAFIEPNSGFWRPIKDKSALPPGAKMETVHFLKARSAFEHRVYALTLEDNAGIMWQLFCLVHRNAAGLWSVESCSGQGGNASLSYRQSAFPQIWLWGDCVPSFYAGGYVIDDSRIGITRVRLFSHEGHIVEDTAEDHCVLFVADQPLQLPLQVEFYDRFDTLIYTASHHSLI